MDEQHEFLIDDLVEVDSLDQSFQDNGELSAYEFLQLCYQSEGISLDILEEIFPTVEFLVSTAAACDERNVEENDYLYYDNEQNPNYDEYYQEENRCASENVSDEEEIDDDIDEKESITESTSEFDNDQLSDRLDIDFILENELKSLNLSRQNRRKNRRKHNLDRSSNLLSGLVQQTSALQLINASNDNDKNSQTELDPVLSNAMFSECFTALSRISDSIPESNDDLDDYRLAASMYVNMKLLENNKQLSWKVDSLGKCLKRALQEMCLFRIALQNTVGDLQGEIELLRKNTLSTIRRIIQGDITRREKIQEQWDEVQTFIRRKNRRINELTEQLNGADLEVGFLLASHKERIEAAAFAERNFFRASERLEDLELELKKKRCLHCESNCESTAQEKLEQAEIQKRREEKRKQFEDDEKQRIANAERYGKVIQNIVSTYQDPKNLNLPWHGNKPLQNGQPPPNIQMPSNGNQPQMNPGFVPFEVYQLTRVRLEEMEKEAKKQERMNEMLSRDLTEIKTSVTKIKGENASLKDENKKLIAEFNKMKNLYQLQRKNGKLSSIDSPTPPESVSSDKSKEEFLPRPPSPPTLSPRIPPIKVEPKILEQTTIKRKFAETSRNPDLFTRMSSTKIDFNRNAFLKPMNNRRQLPLPMTGQKPTEERYFSATVSQRRRSISPEAKRPALSLLPPSLMPPQRTTPTYHKDVGRIDPNPAPIRRDRPFYDDSPAPSFRSFSPPNNFRRDLSPPSPQFEPMYREPARREPPVESWNNRRPPLLGPPPLNNSWQQGPPRQNLQSPPRPMQSLLQHRPMYSNRPSLRPPQISPNPPNMRPAPMNRVPVLPPWHGNPNQGMQPPIRPQVRSSTSWINHSSSFGRR